MSAPTTEPAAAAVHRLGATILREIGIEPALDMTVLAARIVPDEPSAFRGRLRDGLATLLLAIVSRKPATATAAACRLVGVGPGSTPLGDDYIAASGLTLATLGAHAGIGDGEGTALVRALYPRRLATVTTATSAVMITAALAGEVPSAVRGLYHLGADEGSLAASIDELTMIGASSGRAWAAAIGATALLLGPVAEGQSLPGGNHK